MNLLVQAVRRTHLENLKPVWEELVARNHKLYLWVFQDNELSYDQNLSDSWIEGGWNVVRGDYQQLIRKKDYQMVRWVFNKTQPDLLLPLKHTVDVWKETSRAVDLSPWAGKIISFQDAFSAIRGNPQPIAPFPTSSQSTIPWYLVWGNQFREKLVCNGHPADRIIVTGNPAWDWCASSNLSPGRYVLFLGGAPQDWLPGIDFRQIYHDFKEEIFVFKDHPVQADKKYSLKQGLIHLKMFPNKRIKVLNHLTATELLREAKVVITNTSSCAIEAMLCGKPVIIVDTCKESKKFELSGRLTPWTYFSFSRELRTCLKEKEDRNRIPEFLKYVTQESDGRAAQRMVATIEWIGKQSG